MMSGQLVGGGRRDDRAYRELLAEHDRQNAVPAPEIALPALPATAAAVAQEIGAIEHVMRTDRRAYDRDEGMQARLRQLYEAREAAGGSALPATHGYRNQTGAANWASGGSASGVDRSARSPRMPLLLPRRGATWCPRRGSTCRLIPCANGTMIAPASTGTCGRGRKRIVGVQQIIGDKATTDGMEASFRMLPDGVRAALIRELVMARPRLRQRRGR